MLQIEVKSIPESKRYVILLLNEMKIRENIVCNKHTSEMVGFISLGDINNSILDLQRDMDKAANPSHSPIAAHLPALMVLQTRISNLSFWTRQTQCCNTVSYCMGSCMPLRE